MEKIMSKTKNEFGVTSMYITESNRCLTDAELGGVNGGLGNVPTPSRNFAKRWDLMV
jgi:hypothetical protein